MVVGSFAETVNGLHFVVMNLICQVKRLKESIYTLSKKMSERVRIHGSKLDE